MCILIIVVFMPFFTLGTRLRLKYEFEKNYEAEQIFCTRVFVCGGY